MKIEEERPSIIRAWPLIVLGVIMIIGVTFLAWRLWQVQVVEGSRYGEVQLAQSLRSVELPGLRGRILDRNGVVLADNRPAYAIVLYCEELQQPGKWENTVDAIDALIDQLAQRLSLPRQITTRTVRRHIHAQRPMPLTLWEDVDYRTIAYIAEWATELPGLAIIPKSRRHYPNGTLAAHVIGYLGKNPGKLSSEDNPWDYRANELVGRAGLEKQYEEMLSGASGEEWLRVDSRVYTRERWVEREARAGQDLTLTLDVQLQRVAENALNGRPGAVVALDPRNGDILTLASAPTYDLNHFIPGISSDMWKTITNHPQHPLFNRATQAQYAPGSVFKPFVAIAAQERNFNADTLHDCLGVYKDYNLHLRCANRWGHGELDLRQAIMKSCNPYFCYMGTLVGIDAIAATAEQAGFGTKTGIDLPEGTESAGLMPTPEKRTARHPVIQKPNGSWYCEGCKQTVARSHNKWSPADTAQISIGQGTVLATPLQVTVATAAIASGGDVYRPRLVANDPSGNLVRHLPWAHENIRAVIEGMEATVTGGTGQTMQVKGVKVAGKTGTAEYNDRGVRRKHVWSVAFAPAENPEIVVCAMLDNGEGGGKDAGPIVQKVLAEHFKTQAVQVTPDEETLQD